MTKFALSIAASDPSGGAGIEADLKSFCRHRVFGMSAITAITLQGPQGVEKLIPTPARDFRRILKILASQTRPDAVKVGALASASHIRAVKSFLQRVRVPCVLDPVLKSSSGFFLLPKKDWPEIFLLFPLTTLVTPNLPEAESLFKMRVKNLEDMARVMEKFADKGAAAVLLKGGHLEGAPVDLLGHGGRTIAFRKKRVPGRFHGTGCALSAAIAAQLALGLDLEDAVAKAERYMQECLGSAVQIGGIKYLTHF